MNERRLQIGVWLCAALYLGVVLKDAWLSDDAYITFRAVHNFANGYGPTWNIAERVQSFTNPLWMLLLSPLYWLTEEIFYTSLTFSVAIAFATAYLLVTYLSRTKTQALCILSLMVCSKAFVDYSTSGLENPLTHLLIAGFCILYIRNPAPDDRKVFHLSLVTSLALVNRMDTGLIFAPVLLVLLLGRFDRSRLMWMIVGMSPFMAWVAFSVIYYGFPFPNTAYAKLNTGIARVDLLAQGWSYVSHAFQTDPLTPITILVGAAAGIRDRILRPISAGALIYICYVVWIGGDFMAGRFLAAPFLCGLVIIGRSAPLRFEHGRYVLAGVLLVGLLTPRSPLRSGFDYGSVDTHKALDAGISDERAHYYEWTNLWHPRLESHPEAGAGLELREQNPTVDYHFVLGYYGYFAGSAHHIVDGYALADPLLSRLYPDVRRDIVLGTVGMEVRTKPWRIGHFIRRPPGGYLETLETGENLIDDLGIREYYKSVRTVVRGDIWSVTRLGEIWRLNTGYYAHLLEPNLSFTEEQRLAARYIGEGRLESAASSLEQARHIAPDNLENLFWLSTIYQQLEKHSQALELLNRIHDRTPQSVPTAFNRILLLTQTGQSERALGQFRSLITQRPEDWRVLRHLIPKLTELGHSEAAELLGLEARKAGLATRG